MDQQVDIQPITMIAVLVPLVLVGVVLALVQLRRASASKGEWAQIGYRPVAGGRRTGLGRQAAHYVRVYRGFEVHYLTDYKAGYGKTEMAVSWVCPLPRPARFGLQVVEAGLADASLGARASRAVSPYRYNWKPRYVERTHIGDPEVDSRFDVFSTDPAAARRLVGDSGLRPVILSLKHVDLTVAQDQVRLEDPFNVNLWGIGGQALVDVHNRIADILTRASAETQAA